MAEKITYTHLPGDPCLTQEQIFRYIDGTLLPAEMHAVEKHLLDCAFCSDAMEGLEKVKERQKIGAFIPITGNADTTEKPKEDDPKTPIILPLFQRRSTWMAIAATVTLIVGITTVMKLTLSSPDMAKEAPDYAQMSEKDKRMTDSVSSYRLTDSTDVSPETKAVNKENSASTLAVNPAPPSGEKPKMTEQKAASGPGEAKYELERVVAADEVQAPVSTGASISEDFKADRLQEEKNVNRAEADPARTDSYFSDVAKAKDKVVSDDNDQQNQKENKYKEEGSKKTANTSSRNQPAQAQTQAPAASGGVMQESTTVATQTAGDSQQDTVTPRLYPLKASERDLDISYETGVKLLDSGQSDASIAFFDEVLKNPSHHYYEDAQWKKAEALIKLNRKEDAKVLLNQIVTKGGKYKALAQEKLKSL